MNNLVSFIREIGRVLLYALGIMLMLGLFLFLGSLSVPVLIIYFIYKIVVKIVEKKKREALTINGWRVDEY
jgi:hypothetical protein